MSTNILEYVVDKIQQRDPGEGHVTSGPSTNPGLGCVELPTILTPRSETITVVAISPFPYLSRFE